jgi:YHS domain-containing protein
MGKPKQETGELRRDPVCGRWMEPSIGYLSAEYKKKRYYFCSEKCRSAFHHKTERFRMNELAQAGSLLTPGRVRWGLG